MKIMKNKLSFLKRFWFFWRTQKMYFARAYWFAKNSQVYWN